MIVTDHFPLTEAEYARLKLAGRIKHMPDPGEIAADTQRAVERDRERAVRQADAILAAARRGDNR